MAECLSSGYNTACSLRVTETPFPKPELHVGARHFDEYIAEEIMHLLPRGSVIINVWGVWMTSTGVALRKVVGDEVKN